MPSKLTLDDAIALGAKFNQGPYPPREQVAALAAKIGWKPDPKDVAEVDAQLPAWERARAAFVAVDNYDADEKRYFDSLSAAIAEGRPHQEPAPDREDYTRRSRAAREVLYRAWRDAMPAALRLCESLMIALAGAIPNARGATTPLGVVIGPEAEAQLLRGALGLVYTHRDQMVTNPEGASANSWIYPPRTLIFFVLP